MQITHFESVDSTNRLALEARKDGAVFWADTQTAGRGQHGKRWESAASKGLWFSVCLSGSAQGLQFAAALAVRDALTQLEVPVSLKWPNDLLLGSKKLCGILIEHCENWNAVGIGLNVNHHPGDFPPELQGTATSLRIHSGRDWDRETLLHKMVECLDYWVQPLRSGAYQKVFSEWAAACAIVGRHIERDGIKGKVVALENDGALRVQTEQGVVRVDSGCVAILEDS
jgi:BirA family biotin operon repressor/biotin-[acetyl-CoA-carboxylase] ligase